MAVQSSGPISLSDIATEQGISTTNMSLRSMSNTAGFAAPDAITEFYGYSAVTPEYYLDFTRGDALKKQAITPQLLLGSTQDLTISMWVRQDATAAAQQNQILWDLSTNNTTSSDRFFLQYDKNGNRFVVRLRTNSVNFTQNYEIESNNASMGLGTNAATLWSSTNRGNTNSDGWSLLTLVYDASQSTPANAFKFYWNATLVATPSGAGAGTRVSRDVNYITLGNNNHNPTTTAGGFVGGIDEVKIYTSALSASNISTIYNSGVIADASSTYNSFLFTEFTFESDTSDSGGYFPIVNNNTATRTQH